jgi:tyrosinase
MNFVVLACVTLQACAPSGIVGQDVPKESKMQSPPDPKGPHQHQPTAPRVAEMVGATSEPFYLGPEPTEITLAIHRPTGPALLHEGSAKREVYLDIENVSCSEPAPPFRVYLNVPPGDEPEDHPELRVGNLGTFGLLQRSDPKGRHGGNGMTFTLDITESVNHLTAMNNWDSGKLRVTFSPGYWDTQVPRVKVDRVSLYFK